MTKVRVIRARVNMPPDAEVEASRYVLILEGHLKLNSLTKEIFCTQGSSQGCTRGHSHGHRYANGPAPC